MTETTVIVRRDGETLLRVPMATIRDDGTIWASRNRYPLLNGTCAMSKSEMAVRVKAGRFDEIPAAAFMRLGDNPGNKQVIKADQERAEIKAGMTDEDRKAQSAAEDRATKERNWDNLHNEGGDGYNPYRTSRIECDNTPYHKGDDLAD